MRYTRLSVESIDIAPEPYVRLTGIVNTPNPVSPLLLLDKGEKAPVLLLDKGEKVMLLLTNGMEVTISVK